jgi:MFS family permease
MITPQSEGPAAAVAVSPSAGSDSLARIVLASTAGNAIETYDFLVYGLVGSLVFDTAFFPKLDPLSASIAFFSSFAIGFFARPIGAIVFGHFGDRTGRKSVLMVTILLMGLSSAAIGLLPTYATIGVWAPILLVTLRLFEGLALGAESSGANLMALESAPANRRGFYTAVVQSAGSVGALLAAFVAFLATQLPGDAFRAWGWRVPFLIGFLLVFIGAYIRSRVSESPIFQRAAAEKRLLRKQLPIVVVLREHWRVVVTVALTIIWQGVFYYLLSFFVISYSARTLGMSSATLTRAYTAANFVSFCCVPLFGFLSDRIGRKPVYMAGIVLAMIVVYPFLLMLGTRDVWLITAGMVLAVGVIHPMMFGSEASFLNEQFDTPTRFTGAATGRQIGFALGGFAPLIATTVLATTGGSLLAVGVFAICCGVVSLIAVQFTKETRNKDIR